MRRNRPRSKVTLSQRGAGAWHLAGVLDMTSVPTLRDAARKLVDAPEVLVDLGDVTRMDSAGLALLVDWQGQAHRRRTALRFRNVPAAIAAIAEVYGLGAVLPAEDFGTREPLPASTRPVPARPEKTNE
ncbi:MAG: STAS domain-containing protein [Gammaproteobacteria bacterium]